MENCLDECLCPTPSAGIFQKWFEEYCDVTTMHGFGWFNRLERKIFKTVVALACVAVLIVMLVALVQRIDNWLVTEELLTTQKQMVEESLDYPKITLCNPNFFDAQKMESKEQYHYLYNRTSLFS